MSLRKNDNSKDHSSSPIIENNINPELGSKEISEKATMPNQDKDQPIQREVSPEPEIPDLPDTTYENRNQKENKFIPIERKSLNQSGEKSLFQQLKTKTTAALVGSLIMLPILAVGTTTYYFGSQAVKKQAILARRIDSIGVTDPELVREQKLLATLLIGTGATALLFGTISALGTKWLIGRTAKIVAEETEAAVQSQIYKEFIQTLSQSVPQKNSLQAIVEEARNQLNCDRVLVVYSLNQEQCGVVVAESVASDHKPVLGKIIEDSYLGADYTVHNSHERVRAIDNIAEANITPLEREQLQQLEVKANLVSPIMNEDKVLGLLVAHQCSELRQWKQEERDFLPQLAQKVALTLDNSRLLNDLARFQALAKAERTWTNYFTDAIVHIRQSLQQEDILNISVEEVRRVLKCDRVVVYSLNQEQYGVVVAESVAPGYTRALNRTIKDPCFEARYLDKYRDGRVRALNNIYEAGMTSCYL
ncbi:MAG: GAF domain-containing protein, partial [Xenococcaceae cyanobacterium MO_188.B19]|nr:GAF domain-containing protein [Xenococcaceae cyanobacterium MO_188.B19]